MARPTIQTVAEQASVSRQTVSNVLNAPHLVRPETLQRVQGVIDALGYRPHHAARTLRTRRSLLVGVRIEPPQDGLIGAVLDRFLHAVTSQAQEQGYRILLFSAVDDAREMAQYDQLLDDHDLDAFILTGTHVGDARTQWLTQRRVPFVTFGRPWGATSVGHGWVDVNGAAGTADATELLISQGHRRIAFLGWPSDGSAGDDRRDGGRQACRAGGLAIEGLELSGLDRVESGRKGMASLLSDAQPPTAVVCVSDSLALGAWSELAHRGLRPGADVALIGFDDSPTAQTVGLSSIAQPLEQAAAACVAQLRTVLEAATATSTPPEPVLLTPRLVVRASSSPA